MPRVTIIPNLSPLNLTDDVTCDEIDVVVPVFLFKKGRIFLAETKDKLKEKKQNTKIKILKIFFMYLFHDIFKVVKSQIL